MADESKTLKTKLGDCIRGLRHEAGLSQEDLADESRLHANYIGMVERGERKITVEAATRVARSFGLKLSQLLALIDE